MKRRHIVWMMIFSSCVNAYDFPKKTLKSYRCIHCFELSHEPLQSQWAIEDTPLYHVPSTIQKSFSYEQKISAKELQEGVSLSIQAPGAVILLTPLQEKPLPEIYLQLSPHKIIPLKSAATLEANNDALSESLMAVPYQNMMQINPKLGTGVFQLKTNLAHTNSDEYLLHVYDKYSFISLSIQCDKLQYQYNEQLNAIITIQGNKQKISEKEVSAYLISPSNEIFPLKMTQTNPNEFHVSTTLLSEYNPKGENWYLEIELWKQGNKELHRTARGAFSYSIPSASLLSVKKTNENPITFLATIEVASASRYSLQGVLFDENKKPLEMAQSAQWLEPGIQTVKFKFNNSQQLPEKGLFLGNLQLVDYGQLKAVYQYDALIQLDQL